jgi:hypothetical protein
MLALATSFFDVLARNQIGISSPPFALGLTLEASAITHGTSAGLTRSSWVSFKKISVT